MQLNIKDNIKFYTFEKFEKSNLVKHCFSTKHGGVSTGVYSTMNLGFRGDEKSNVLKNYELICKAIGTDFNNTVFSSQIHEDKVYLATKEDIGKGLLKESDINGYDALITNEKNIILTTFYADCVPIFILDPINKAIGLAHSGWKGTVKEIGLKTALKMKKEFNTNYKDLIVGIAPSISKCCFQVSEDVVKIFLEKLPYSKEFIFKDEKVKNKFRIDLQNIIKKSFLDLGVLKENIEISGICTMCNNKMFFSHRVMGENRGSLAALISLV